jgi:hypothetical protein
MFDLVDIGAAQGLEGPALAALSDDELEALAASVAAGRRALEALWLRVLECARTRSLHVRRGGRDTATWAASLSGDRRRAVRRDVVVAEQVSAAPRVAAALSAGTVSKAQAEELARGRSLPPDVQDELLGQVAVMPVEQLAREVTRACLDHGVDDAPLRPSLTLTPGDTRLRVAGHLEAEDGEYVIKAVDVAVDRMQLPTDVPYDERRARGLGAVCRFFLDHVDDAGSARTGGRPHVLTVVPVETLLAETGGSARLESGMILRGAVARRLACDAGISRIITAGRSEILDVGRTTRSIPPALARAVIARDRHCTHPNCHAPPWLCEIHHIVHWAVGGTTSLDNLRLLCWWDHQQAHEHGPPPARARAPAA